MNFLSKVSTPVFDAAYGAGTGFLAVTTAIAAGKTWIVLTGSTQTVHSLLGFAATTGFRRQATVGCAVYYTVTNLIMRLADTDFFKGSYEKSKGIHARRQIIRQVLITAAPPIGLAAGAAVACSSLTATLYRPLKYAAIALMVFNSIAYVYNNKHNIINALTKI